MSEVDFGDLRQESKPIVLHIGEYVRLSDCIEVVCEVLSILFIQRRVC